MFCIRASQNTHFSSALAGTSFCILYEGIQEPFCVYYAVSLHIHSLVYLVSVDSSWCSFDTHVTTVYNSNVNKPLVLSWRASI